MAFNIFKKKEKEKEAPQKAVNALAMQEAAKAPAQKAGAQKRKIEPGILAQPHITEKATFLAEKGQYVFRVASHATKPQIRQAVEGLYGVNVKDVRVSKKREKSVRVGRREGIKPGFKKAVVQLQKGQVIEVVSR